MKTLNVGFELEFETTQSSYTAEAIARQLLEKMNVGSIHGDGSLDSGYEFSSNIRQSSEFVFPTYNTKVWETFFAKMQANDVFVREHCGMHVHIDRNALTVLDIAKMNYFLIRNVRFCEMVAHRRLTNYCRDVQIPTNCIRTKTHYAKYSMLNIHDINTTVELRFFKSTWNLKCFLQNMQFAIALVDFVKHAGVSLDAFRSRGYAGQNWSTTVAARFCAFVQAHKLTYRELYKFLVLKKHLDAPKYRGRKTLEYKNKVAQRFARSTRASSFRNMSETWRAAEDVQLNMGREMNAPDEFDRLTARRCLVFSDQNGWDFLA